MKFKKLDGIDSIFKEIWYDLSVFCFVLFFTSELLGPGDLCLSWNIENFWSLLLQILLFHTVFFFEDFNYTYVWLFNVQQLLDALYSPTLCPLFFFSLYFSFYWPKYFCWLIIKLLILFSTLWVVWWAINGILHIYYCVVHF